MSAAVLQLVPPPEYGDGDGDEPECQQMECPECGGTSFELWENLYGQCTECGCWIDMNDEEDE